MQTWPIRLLVPGALLTDRLSRMGQQESEFSGSIDYVGKR